MREIGITGAAGFVGLRLTRSLVRAGRSLRLFSRANGVGADGLQITALARKPELFAGLDSLIHLAGLTSSKASEEQLTRINVDLTVDVAKAAAEAGVRRFVFFSSLGVHGKAGGRIGPNTVYAAVNAYGRSKVAAEQALKSISANTGMELTIIRPPMIYGPNARGSFNALFKLVKSGFPLPFGLARAERTFCSIENVISATTVALNSPRTGILIPGDLEDFSTRSLIEAMALASGREKPVLIPVSPWMIRKALGTIGRGDMAASLFDPLTIDRDHWREWDWTPPEKAFEGVKCAVASL